MGGAQQHLVLTDDRDRHPRERRRRSGRVGRVEGDAHAVEPADDGEALAAQR